VAVTPVTVGISSAAVAVILPAEGTFSLLAMFMVTRQISSAHPFHGYFYPFINENMGNHGVSGFKFGTMIPVPW